MVNGAADVVHAPFGGFKESGIGREGSRFAIEEYTEIQAVTWRA
jgi:acyl-CoA reductase-like NAD-dependent aldehyde dehydrogenase